MNKKIGIDRGKPGRYSNCSAVVCRNRTFRDQWGENHPIYVVVEIATGFNLPPRVLKQRRPEHDPSHGWALDRKTRVNKADLFRKHHSSFETMLLYHMVEAFFEQLETRVPHGPPNRLEEIFPPMAFFVH